MLRFRDERRSRRRIGCFVTTALFAVVLTGLLLWRAPQRALVQYALGKVSGAHAELDACSLFPAIEIPHLTLHDLRIGSITRSAITLGGLRIDYRILPRGGKWVDRVSLRKLAVTLDGRGLAPPDHQSGKSSVSQSSRSFDPTPFLPREIQLGEFSMDIRMPAWTMELGSIRAVGRIDALNDLAVEVTAEPMSAAWSSKDLNIVYPSVQGTLRAGFTRREDHAEAHAAIALPDFAEADGNAAFELTPAGAAFEVDAPRAAFEGPAWPGIVSFFSPVPIRFDAVRAESLHAAGEYRSGSLDIAEAGGMVKVEGLSIGAPAAPWYEGPVRVDAQGGLGGGRALNMSLTLNREQRIEASFTGDTQSVSGTASLKEWPREKVLTLVPAAYRPVLETYTAFEQLSMDGAFEWKAPAYTVQAHIAPRLAGKTAPIALTAHGTPGSADMPWFDGKMELPVETGNIECTAEISPDSIANSTVRIKELSLSACYQMVFGVAPPWPVDFTLNGEASAKIPPGKPAPLSAALTFSRVSVPPITLPEDAVFSVQGQAQLAPAAAGLHNISLSAACGESFQISLKRGLATQSPLAFSGELEGTADLEWLGGITGFPDLYGDVSWHMPLRFAKETFHAAAKLTAETLGYGDWALPYGTPLDISAILDSQAPWRAAEVSAVEARLGEGTRLTCERIGTAKNPDTGEWQFHAPSASLESDLAPVVSLGFFEAAEGSAELRAENLFYQPPQLGGKTGLTLNAAKLTLPGGLAALSNVQLEIKIEDLAALSGDGGFSAEEITAAGVVLRAFRANLALQNGVAVVEIPDTALFDGIVNARAEFHLREPGIPMTVSGKLNNIDLAVFSREVKPPAVVLSGRASGEFEISGDLSGVRDLDASLRCAEGFTINRDVVEQLALYTQGIAIVGKSLQRAIGEQDPRPFDRAEVSVGYQAGNTTVSLFVSSRLLDLAPVFYIKADLADLFRLLRENQIQNIQRISGN